MQEEGVGVRSIKDYQSVSFWSQRWKALFVRSGFNQIRAWRFLMTNSESSSDGWAMMNNTVMYRTWVRASNRSSPKQRCIVFKRSFTYNTRTYMDCQHVEGRLPHRDVTTLMQNWTWLKQQCKAVNSKLIEQFFLKQLTSLLTMPFLISFTLEPQEI